MEASALNFAGSAGLTKAFGVGVRCVFASLSAHCDPDCQKRREDALALLKLRKNSPILFANFRQSFEMIGNDQRGRSAKEDSRDGSVVAFTTIVPFAGARLFCSRRLFRAAATACVRQFCDGRLRGGRKLMRKRQAAARDRRAAGGTRQ